jgi:hypothetical protein
MILLNKRHIEVLILPLAFLSSCATILNKPVQKIFISTHQNARVQSVGKAVVIDSSLFFQPITKAYYVPRSNEPLVITLEVDSTTKQVSLRPTRSFAYWYNILSNYGIGMLVDKNNMKRYAYPIRNYFSVKDTTITISRFAPVEKGSMNLTISLPFMTQFTIKTTDRTYISAGIFGAEAGWEYYYKRDHYLSLHAGAATDAFGEYIGPGYFDMGNTLFTSVRNNTIIGSFDFGYGIHLSQLKWIRHYRDTTKTDQAVKNKGLGVSVSTQYRIGNYFRIGAIYQPMLLAVNSRPFANYQHYLSINLIWKFPISTSYRRNEL